MKKIPVSLAAARVELDESLQFFRHLGDRRSIAGQVLTLEQAIQEMSSLERVQDRNAQSLAPATEMLYLNAFGPMHVQKGEQVLTAWPYARVKELLFYLVSYQPRTKAQIGLGLWPDASTAQLRNSLGTTLYHLRRVLGNPEWILFEEDQYHFNRTLPYRFDVEVFESNLAEARRLQRTAPEQATTLLQEAIQLYQGDFLEDCIEGKWFLLQREELWRKYLDALLDLGALLFSQGRYNGAADTYRRAIEKENILESAHRELMRCYARLGERGRALRQYQALQHIMQIEFGSAPAPESVALYERLKRGEEA
jgi:DNA-binding SARP family transcriptional activator